MMKMESALSFRRLYFKKRVIIMTHRNGIEYKVYGKYALFTDPLTKIGGEKFSYEIPTYSALKGITESIYWKPTIVWVIDSVRIMKPIQTQSQGIRPIHYQDTKNDLSIYTYLRDVEYHVRAHFEWNLNRPDLAHDRNENKHWDIAKRMIERGGRRDVFLGTRECQGYVEPCDFCDGTSVYDGIDERAFGAMVHGITYPDEQTEEKYRGKMTVRLWKPVMRNSVVDFIPPTDKNIIIREIGKRNVKQFVCGENFSGLSEFDREGVF